MKKGKENNDWIITCRWLWTGKKKKVGRPKTNTVGRPKEKHEEWLKGKSWSTRADIAFELYYKYVKRIYKERLLIENPIKLENKALKYAVSYVVDIYTIGYIETEKFYDIIASCETVHNEFIRNFTGELIKSIL